MADAPIFQDSFDSYNGVGANTGLQAVWNLVDAGGGAGLVAGRFGGQALQLTDGTGSQRQYRRNLGVDLNTFNVQCAIRHNHLVNIGNQPFMSFGAGGTVQFSFYLSGADGRINVYRGLGTTLIGQTPVNEIVNATWHDLEVYGQVENAGALILALDGEPLVTLPSVDIMAHATANYLNFVELWSPDGSGSGSQQWFDDLIVRNQAMFYGPRRIERSTPVADTADKDFAPSTGTSNFAMLDEAAVLTTDYTQGATVGDKDMFEMSDLSSDPEEIDAVTVKLFAVKTDAAARAIRIVIDVNGIEAESDDIFLASSYGFYSATFDVNPETGAEWDKLAIDALKVGYRISI